MSKNKDFFDKPIFTLPSYLLWFLQGGAYFFITNILLVLFITATAINPDSFNLMFLFISLLPLGPSLSALSASTSEILREKSISFSSYFFKSYKDNFVALAYNSFNASSYVCGFSVFLFKYAKIWHTYYL